MDFINQVGSSSFNGTQALDMMHRLCTIDYGARREGSGPLKVTDEIDLKFYLDYISVIGLPLKVISRDTSHFFDNITMSFQYWQTPYRGKHLYGLPFELWNRTFRIAAASTRETWFIVMHPVVGCATELPASNSERRQRMRRSARSSALLTHHAEAMASQIKKVFTNPDLLGEGVEPSWKLGGRRATKIASNKWTRFQEIFMDEWAGFVSRHSFDQFWMENRPAFHAYDFGANIEITIDPDMGLEPEHLIRADDQDSSDDESPRPDAGRHAEGRSRVSFHQLMLFVSI